MGDLPDLPVGRPFLFYAPPPQAGQK